MFYIEAVQQIKKGFVFEEIHRDAEFLNPLIANELMAASLHTIAKRYLPEGMQVNFSELDKEWRAQSLIDWEQGIPTKTLSYWKIVLQKQNFKQLPTLINFFMALPFSNASVERFFSSLKNVKSEKRNRLDNETLGAILCVKYGLKRTGRTASQLTKNEFSLPQLKNVIASATSSESRMLRKQTNTRKFCQVTNLSTDALEKGSAIFIIIAVA